MIFYPKGYFNKVSEISLEYLRENNIKGLILDVDNTLIDYYRNLSEETIAWVNELKQNGIKMYILSNSNKKDKVEEVSEKLKVEHYSYFAKKPSKSGFKRAKKKLELEANEIAVVGDQIFTDVLGANIMKMHSILVDPIKEKDIFVTLIKRPIENDIKRRYLENKEKNGKNSISDVQIVEKIDIDHTVAKVESKNRSKRESREEK